MNKKIYHIHEAAIECGIGEETIVHYIQQRWIEPAEQLDLDEEDIARARLIGDLQEIFGVNEAAIPVILHLVDQLLGAKGVTQ